MFTLKYIDSNSATLRSTLWEYFGNKRNIIFHSLRTYSLKRAFSVPFRFRTKNFCLSTVFSLLSQEYVFGSELDSCCGESAWFDFEERHDPILNHSKKDFLLKMRQKALLVPDLGFFSRWQCGKSQITRMTILCPSSNNTLVIIIAFIQFHFFFDPLSRPSLKSRDKFLWHFMVAWGF